MNRIQCQAFYEEIKNIFSPLASMAFITVDHETLFLKYKNLADIGTLGQCAEVSHSYLHLQDGDIVLTNDPYSGGTLLSSPTLIMGIGTKTVKGSIPAEYLVASRITLPIRVGSFKTIDDEGLRIPPSPYYLRGEPNAPIVEALKSHPMLTPQFTDRVTQEAKVLLDLRQVIKTKISKGKLDLNKQNIKSYLQATSREFERRIEDLAEGSRSIEMAISPKETVRLKLDHIDGHFHFDFTGTSSGEDLFLTDSTTIGTVIGATLSLLNQSIPINSGIFSRFDVKAPRGSFLNAAFPRPLFLGHTDGTYLLANAVVRCMSLISKKHSVATTGASSCQYQVKFNDKSIFSDQLQPGTGGSAAASGSHGISLWNLNDSHFSVEEIERLYPLQILSTGFRAESGGAGRHTGGQGVVRRLKLLDQAELRWCFAVPPHNPEGAEGGKSALGASLVLHHADGQKEELEHSGVKQLKKGDVLTVLSPGGGGFGLPS